MDNPIKMDDLGVPLFSETSILLFWPNIMPFRQICANTQTFGAPELDRQPGVEPDAHGELLLRWDDPVMVFQMKRSEDHFELGGFKKRKRGNLDCLVLNHVCLSIYTYKYCM